LLAAVVSGAGLVSLVIGSQAVSAQDGLGEVIEVGQAHERAERGEVVLVDVRSSAEWKETGVPSSAHAITMHQDVDKFVAMVDAAMGGDKTRPLAVICATGSRTTFLQAALRKLGFSRPMNVVAGMMGGRYGVGWIKAGLPVRPWRGLADTAPLATGLGTGLGAGGQ
jgi:rhodanese-related sulfurtransferase